MSKAEKLLEKAQRSPQSLKFTEFEALLIAFNWRLRRQTGSHRIWQSPKGYGLPVQPEKSMAKTYQVRQFLQKLKAEAGV